MIQRLSAALVAVKSRLAGAISRTLAERMSDTVSVKDFGAKGDGVTDDTQAIRNAVLGMSVNGGTLYFPDGDYLCTGTIPVHNKPIIFKGAGEMSSSIIYTGGDVCIEFVSDSVSNVVPGSQRVNRLGFEDIGILKSTVSGGIAVRARWKAMTSNDVLFSTYNFRVYCKDDGAKGWYGMLNLINVNGIRMSNTHLYGEHQFTELTTPTPYKTQFGVQLYNDSQSEGSSLGMISFFIDNLTIMRTNVSWDVIGWHEGFAFSNCEFVQNAYGTRVRGDAVKQNPVMLFVNCHMDVRYCAIDAENVFKLKTVNCDLFKHSNNTVDGQIVTLKGCNQPNFIGTTFSSNDTTKLTNGILMDAQSYQGVIQGCTFGLNGVGAELRSAYWSVNGNTFNDGNVGLRLIGTNNQIGSDNTFVRVPFPYDVQNQSNVIQPKLYTVTHSHTHSDATQYELNVQVPIPAGVFTSAPDVATIVSEDGDFFVGVYVKSTSNQNLAVFRVRNFLNTQIGAGTYKFNIMAGSKLA